MSTFMYTDFRDFTDGELYDYYKWLRRLIKSELPAEIPMRESRKDRIALVSAEILRRSQGKTHFAGHELAAKS